MIGLSTSWKSTGVSSGKELFHHLEDLRDRLCDASSFDAALTEVRSLYPVIDDKKLARLARSVHDNNDKKAAREIFRRLRKAAETEDE